MQTGKKSTSDQGHHLTHSYTVVLCCTALKSSEATKCWTLFRSMLIPSLQLTGCCEAELNSRPNAWQLEVWLCLSLPTRIFSNWTPEQHVNHLDAHSVIKLKLRTTFPKAESQGSRGCPFQGRSLYNARAVWNMFARALKFRTDASESSWLDQPWIDCVKREWTRGTTSH